MARIRTIKPGFWRHEVLSTLPESTHMLAAALLNYADDDGFFNAHPGLVKAECMPLREPSVTVPVMLQDLSKAGFIRLGTGADGKRYGHIVTFSEHQVISHKTPSKIKDMCVSWDDSGTPTGEVPEPSHPEEEGNKEEEEEGNSVGRASATAQPPPIPEMLKRSKEPKHDRPRATRLDADWQPSADDTNYAEQRGFTDAEIRDMAESFRAYFTSGPGRLKTWVQWGGGNGAWGTWVRNQAKRHSSSDSAHDVGGNRQSSGGVVAAVRRIVGEEEAARSDDRIPQRS